MTTMIIRKTIIIIITIIIGKGELQLQKLPKATLQLAAMIDPKNPAAAHF